MKNILIICFAIYCLPNRMSAQNWTFHPTQSQLTWSGKAAFSTYTLGGTIQLKAATIIIDNEIIQTGNFLFDMKTIDGEIKDLTKHLKSKDFFEVKKYKMATFELIEITINDAGKQIAKGQLTIKEETKPIEFILEQAFNKKQLTIKGKAMVNRTDFGITFNSPSFFEKLKDQAIADDFELAFELVFLKE